MVDKYFDWIENESGLSKVKGIAIDEIVDTIKGSMVKMQEDMESSGIRIKRIELTLKTLASGETGAEVKLQIPILGGLNLSSKISSKSIQTTVLALKPATKKGDEKDMIKMDEKLEKSILSLTEGIKAAVKNPPLLEMEEASTEFNFVLASNSDISMIIKSGFESELTNNLKILFEKNK